MDSACGHNDEAFLLTPTAIMTCFIPSFKDSATSMAELGYVVKLLESGRDFIGAQKGPRAEFA